MSKTLTSASKTKIISLLVNNFWEKQKSFGKKVSLQKTKQKIFAEIKSVGNIGEYLDFRDFSETLNYGLKSNNETEFQNRLKNMFEFQNFTYHIPINSIERVPDNLKLGKCVTIPFSQFPHDSSEPFLKDIMKRYDKTTANKNLFLKTIINTIGNENASKKFEVIIEDTLHILKFFFNSDLRFSSYVLKTDKYPDFLFGVHWAPAHFPAVYNPTMLQGLKILGSIFERSKLTEIEERIKKAVILVSISRGIRYDGFQLSVLCSALEALLTTKNEPITLKLSERISFLVKIKKMRRIDVYKEIKQLYSLRSSFVHQTEDGNSVGKQEVDFAHGYIVAVMNRLFNLHDKGYAYVTSTGNPKKSVIDGIEALKFGQIKKL